MRGANSEGFAVRAQVFGHTSKVRRRQVKLRGPKTTLVYEMTSRLSEPVGRRSTRNTPARRKIFTINFALELVRRSRNIDT